MKLLQILKANRQNFGDLGFSINEMKISWFITGPAQKDQLSPAKGKHTLHKNKAGVMNADGMSMSPIDIQKGTFWCH